MKRILMCALTLLIGSPAFANHWYSNRVVSTDPHPQAMSPGVIFTAYSTEILNPKLFKQLFAAPKCATELSDSLTLRALTAEQLHLAIGGETQKAFDGSTAKFIPSYMHFGVSKPAHYRVRLKDSSILHIAIEDGFFHRTLKIGRVEQQGDEWIVRPIMEASGY